MYYGNPVLNTGMYTTLDGAESAFRAEFIKVDRIATDLDNVVRRTKKLNHNYELSKVRWAAAGHSVWTHEVEMERLEFGRPHHWDPRYDSPANFTSLAQVFPELCRSRYDERGAA